MYKFHEIFVAIFDEISSEIFTMKMCIPQLHPLNAMCTDIRRLTPSSKYIYSSLHRLPDGAACQTATELYRVWILVSTIFSGLHRNTLVELAIVFSLSRPL